jgi:Mrp family chromosome partitioning ATPase
MVERLKEAIARAREQRVGAGPAVGRPEAAAGANIPAAWSATPTIDVSPQQLAKSRIVSVDRVEPAHVPIDVLRTRVQAQCAAHGWRRIAVTSPSAGCGKSTVSLNLAFSLARQPETRVVLLDFDLRRPALARMLGVEQPRWPLPETIRRDGALDAVLTRVAGNLVLGLNTVATRDSAELLRSRKLMGALDRMMAALNPDVVLFDLPPLFAGDDTVGFLPHVDATLVVAASGETCAKDIEEMERLLVGVVPVLGIVLNKCSEPQSDPYAENYYG